MRIKKSFTTFLSTCSIFYVSYELGDEDLLEIRRRSAYVVFAYVAVIQITHVRIFQNALQALHREVRQFPIDDQFVQIVHRVTRSDSFGLKMIGMYNGLRVRRQLCAANVILDLFSILRTVLYDTRRERSHVDLYLADSLRGQQLHLRSFALKIFKIVIGDRGDGATASASAPAGTHSVEVAVIQVATLVIGAIISVTLAILPLMKVLMKALLQSLSHRVIVFFQVIGSCIEHRSMISGVVEALISSQDISGIERLLLQTVLQTDNQILETEHASGVSSDWFLANLVQTLGLKFSMI